MLITLICTNTINTQICSPPPERNPNQTPQKERRKKGKSCMWIDMSTIDVLEAKKLTR